MDSAQLMSMLKGSPPAAPNGLKGIVQKARNETGLPDQLKTGVESLSGCSMDDVRVHYSSSKPAQLEALAYTQGSDIHVAPGQEKHLPHEAWHVVQQKQGRVLPTMQMKGVNVNDNEGLEQEATVMGQNALQCKAEYSGHLRASSSAGIAQRAVEKIEEDGNEYYRSTLPDRITNKTIYNYFNFNFDKNNKFRTRMLAEKEDMKRLKYIIECNHYTKSFLIKNGANQIRGLTYKKDDCQYNANNMPEKMRLQKKISEKISEHCHKNGECKNFVEIQCSLNRKNYDSIYLSSNDDSSNNYLKNNTIILKIINDEILSFNKDNNTNFKEIKEIIIPENTVPYVPKNDSSILNNPKFMNGRHAETRIIDDSGWDFDNYYLPLGTKPACRYCNIYIAKKIDIFKKIEKNPPDELLYYINNYSYMYNSDNSFKSIYKLYSEKLIDIKYFKKTPAIIKHRGEGGGLRRPGNKTKNKINNARMLTAPYNNKINSSSNKIEQENIFLPEPSVKSFYPPTYNEPRAMNKKEHKYIDDWYRINNYRLEDVSSAGNNCLIRAIMLAATGV